MHCYHLPKLRSGLAIEWEVDISAACRFVDRVLEIYVSKCLIRLDGCGLIRDREEDKIQE